jgi:DNA polymerase III delta subunit
MLYVLHGTDRDKVRGKLHELVASLEKKRPDAQVLKIGVDNWKESKLDEYVSGMNLFAPKNIIILDSLYSNKEIQSSVDLDVLAESENVCIVVEQKLTKENLKKLEKRAEKVQEFNLPEVVKKKESPITFSFVEALVNKDKKRSWSLFQKLAADSVAAEEIHGVIWWQFKTLYLAHMSTDAANAGLNPFVHQKAKVALKNWNKETLSQMLKRLVLMYHKAHRGECDFVAELEILCLE